MFQSLEVFKLSSQMAAHAGQRQSVIAQNIANADTPDYQARDIASFKDLVRPQFVSIQKATRSSHLNGTVSGYATLPMEEDPGQSSINGNTVTIEEEMMKAVDTKRQHDRALSIYSSAMQVLRTTVARG